MHRALRVAAITTLLAGCAHKKLPARDQARIEGQTWVITGASSGLGRGMAVEVGSHGGNVVLAARRADALEEVAAEIRAAGGRALVVPTDVSDPAQVAALADAAIAGFGGVDVWVNNAGVGTIGRQWEVPLEDQARIVDVNLKGVLYGTHYAIRHFRERGSGTLVNVGSSESEVPMAYHAAYAATKAGVLALDRALVEELRLDGQKDIEVTTIMPWAVDTPWWTHAANYIGGTPRIRTMDGPEKVVVGMVRASLHPREEAPIGWKAKSSYRFHRWAPDVTERSAASAYHLWQVELAPPAPDTQGAIHAPNPGTTTVDGGVRARMDREEDERKAKRKAEKGR